MKKKLFIAMLAIAIILIILFLVAYIYLKLKLNAMNYQPIDKNEIGVNVNLYGDIQASSKLSENEFKDVQSFVLFGSDSRDVSNIEAGRSDTIIICSINPKTKSIKLISIPRDTYVMIPGYYQDKINHAYAFGQETLSLRTINENFGLNIDKYVTIDFSGLIDVINQLGGIELEIDKDEMNYINSIVLGFTEYSNGKITKLTNYGKVTLTGEQALAHSRNRTTGVGNDFVRADRQRQVVAALIKKTSTMSYNKILALSDSILKDVKTNITSDEYMKIFSGILAQKDEYLNNVFSVQIPNTNYASGQIIKGIYYFVTDINKAKQEFVEYIFNK